MPSERIEPPSEPRYAPGAACRCGAVPVVIAMGDVRRGDVPGGDGFIGGACVEHTDDLFRELRQWIDDMSARYG